MACTAVCTSANAVIMMTGTSADDFLRARSTDSPLICGSIRSRRTRLGRTRSYAMSPSSPLAGTYEVHTAASAGDSDRITPGSSSMMRTPAEAAIGPSPMVSVVDGLPERKRNQGDCAAVLAPTHEMDLPAVFLDRLPTVRKPQSGATRLGCEQRAEDPSQI